MLPFAAANRVSDVFDDPDAMRIDRKRNRHLTFGSGARRYLGSNLARLELRVTLEEWLRVIPEFRLDSPAASSRARADPRPRARRLRGGPVNALPRSEPGASYTAVPASGRASAEDACDSARAAARRPRRRAGALDGRSRRRRGARRLGRRRRQDRGARRRADAPCLGFAELHPDAPNGAFTLANRGKRFIELDMRSEPGRAVLGRLLASADVLLSNLRPSALTRLGLSPADVASATRGWCSARSPPTAGAAPTRNAPTMTWLPSSPGPASRTRSPPRVSPGAAHARAR